MHERGYSKSRLLLGAVGGLFRGGEEFNSSFSIRPSLPDGYGLSLKLRQTEA
jgi:hypothetical protein